MTVGARTMDSADDYDCPGPFLSTFGVVPRFAVVFVEKACRRRPPLLPAPRSGPVFLFAALGADRQRYCRVPRLPPEGAAALLLLATFMCVRDVVR
eukprot:4559931-Pyramimonas_sp.AAC.1